MLGVSIVSSVWKKMKDAGLLIRTVPLGKKVKLPTFRCFGEVPLKFNGQDTRSIKLLHFTEPSPRAESVETLNVNPLLAYR